MIRTTTTQTLRLCVPVHPRSIVQPHCRHLTTLYPAVIMSRRSTRLSSGQLSSSPISSTTTLPQYTRYSTEAGPSNLTSYSDPIQEQRKDAIPSFEEWTTSALQAEVKRYGFKVSRKRSTLIDQLKAVYEALHRPNSSCEAPVARNEAENIPVEAEIKQGGRTKRKLVLPESAASAKGLGKGKGRRSDPFVLDASSDSDASLSSPSAPIQGANGGYGEEQEEIGDYTAQLELEALSATDGSSSPSSSDVPLSTHTSPSKPRRGRPPSRSRSPSTSSLDVPLASTTTAETEGEPTEPTPALAETMTTAIRSTPIVWDRILRYEPISFDEFVSIATQNELQMDTGKRKDELRTWLDRQCICFYSNDLTGPRSRH